jgi:hypothetical protein
MTDWQLRRVNDNTVDDSLQSLELTDTFNRFARIAEVELDDPESVKVSEYPRGTLVELEVAVEGFFSFSRRFAGFVADYTQDRNRTSLTILSHDFWVRKRTVNRSFIQTRLDVILQTLIEDLTPLTYDSSLVDIQTNPEISREWRGEQLEVVLEELGEISGGNEDYGATNDLEFFFREREFESSPRDFEQGEYIDVEWNQDGKREVNRAIIEYGEDDSAGVQIREDASAQLDLQEQLNSDDPVVIEERKAYPEITDPDAAADKAKQLLNDKSTLTTGELSTWEAFAVRPGEVTTVVDPETDTNGEFIVAEITYRWPGESPETQVTVADKSVATSEELINLSDDITRVDLRATDADAPVEQNIPTQVGASIEPTAILGSENFSEIKLTNTARNLIRDGWRDTGTISVAEIAVGTDNSNLSRTNTSLENETNRASVSESLEGDVGVTYTASVGDNDTREVGLFDSAGNLLVRATFESGGSGASVTLTVGNDPEPPLGVLTDAGQTAIRDIIADNSPVVPQFYAFGDSDTTPQESDTTLGNQIAKQNLDEILIQRAQSTADFSELVGEIADDTPLEVSNDKVGNTQICFFSEGENYDTGTEGFDGGSSDSDISNNDYATFSRGPNAGGPDFAEWEFTPSHTIPGSEFAIYVRHSDYTDGSPELIWTLEHANGNSYTLDENTNLGADIIGFSWVELPLFAGGSIDTPADLEAGETHTLRLEVTNSDGVTNQYQYWVDCVAPIDNRYVSDLTFGETTDANDTLAGPELYPSVLDVAFSTADTRRDVTQANFTSTWNDTSNNQYVELANDGSTFTRVNNSSSGSVTFTNPNTGVDAIIGISRYATDTTTTPRNGDSTQEISSWELFANPDAVLKNGIGRSETRAVFPSGGALEGNVLREAGQLGPSDELLSRSIFSDIPRTGTIPSSMTIISSEITTQSQGITPEAFDSASVTARTTPNAREQWVETSSVTATANPTAIDQWVETASVTATSSPEASESLADAAQAQMLAHVGQKYSVLETEANVSAERAQQLTKRYS